MSTTNENGPRDTSDEDPNVTIIAAPNKRIVLRPTSFVTGTSLITSARPTTEARRAT